MLAIRILNAFSGGASLVAVGTLCADSWAGRGVALELPVTKALAYTSRLRTLRLEGGAIGTAQGKVKRIARLTVRVLNAMCGKAGTDEARMEDLIRRDASDPMDASPPLRSGDFDVFPASDYDSDGQISIVQDGPLALDILCVMPRVTVGEG